MQNYSRDQLRAYRALRHAAEQIGREMHRRGVYKPRKGGYTITDNHKRIIEAMPSVLQGRMSPEEAVAIVTECEVMNERFPVTGRRG